MMYVGILWHAMQHQRWFRVLLGPITPVTPPGAPGGLVYARIKDYMYRVPVGAITTVSIIRYKNRFLVAWRAGQAGAPCHGYVSFDQKGQAI